MANDKGKLKPTAKEHKRAVRWDKPVSLPHLNVEDMDEVEGKWRKRRDGRKGLV